MGVVSDGHEAHSRKDVQPFDGPVDDFVEPEQRKDEVGEVENRHRPEEEERRVALETGSPLVPNDLVHFRF